MPRDLTHKQFAEQLAALRITRLGNCGPVEMFADSDDVTAKVAHPAILKLNLRARRDAKIEWIRGFFDRP